MTIQMLAPDAPIIEIEEIAAIINRVYKEAEKGIWSDGQVRTDADEIRTLAENEELAVARVDGKIAGCVRLAQIDADTGEFGILAVDHSQQGAGIGRELVYFAEKRMRDAHVPSMQIKLLVPRAGMDTNPTKVNLNNWYTRLGYQKTGTKLIEEAGQRDSPSVPSHAPDEATTQIGIKLAIPCEFIIFRKKLR